MKRHSGLCLALLAGFVAILANSPTIGQDSEFRARMAAWQQPRAARSSSPADTPRMVSQPATEDAYYEGEFAGGEIGCGDGACNGGCGGACDGACGGLRGFRDIGRDPGCRACMPCRRPMWWLRSDGLLWWRKGRDLPVLVTSSTSAVPPPGEIVLFGGDIEGGPPEGGARIDFGTWLDEEECLGIGGRFWGIGKERIRFDADSVSLPNQTIERPFTNANGDPDSLVISDPFTPFDGSIQVVATSEVFGVDAYARMAWCRGCDFRIDLIGGYQFSRINEDLLIDSSSQQATLVVSDRWLTRNEFHGGSIGLLYESCHGCWTTTCLVKVGLGSMRQTADLAGFENGQVGGLLVEAPTTVTRDKFAAVPELDVAWSYAINPCWSMNVGYSLLYWSNVARPEALIDPVRGNDTSLIFRDSSLWVQGLTIGASCRF